MESVAAVVVVDDVIAAVELAVKAEDPGQTAGRQPRVEASSLDHQAVEYCL